jgi:Fe-S cluster biosynthesis and repair protein YggX
MQSAHAPQTSVRIFTLGYSQERKTEETAMASTTGPGSKTERKVFCVKLQKELPGLDETPFDNPLGQRIYDHVSKEAWRMWVEQMKMIMNEYRLNLGTPEAQEFLLKQMEEYFFGEGAAHPPGYVAPGH